MYAVKRMDKRRIKRQNGRDAALNERFLLEKISSRVRLLLAYKPARGEGRGGQFLSVDRVLLCDGAAISDT